MKKILTIISILFATTLLFSSCENSWNKVDKNLDEINKMMDQSIKKENKETINNNKNMIFDQLAKPEKWDTIAIFDTSMWEIKVKLFPNKTPKTVENFIKLAEKWYYNWTIFHRVIKDFMIQWWDPDWTWRWWDSIWGWTFKDEFDDDLKNIKWALSMANRWPNTNGSQFFIVQAETTPWLDWMHTVFGQTYEWMDIVDKIADVKKDAFDKPLDDVVVKSIKIEVLK